MNIVVCIKQVPEVADVDPELNDDGTDIDREDLVMDINEWDNYAVEEAIRLKDAHGGTVTAVTLGNEDAEDVLRRALAMGADAAIRVDAEAFEGADAVGIARGLHGAIKDMNPDLVLTGAMSSDFGWGQVGVALAELLGLPYASLAVKIEVGDGKLTVHRELESNTHEKVELPLPALVTVQTGINDPRYVSIMGIRRVRGVAIEEKEPDDIGLDEGEIGREGSSIAATKLSVPERGAGAEMLAGGMDAICDRMALILRERGGVA